MGCFGGGGSIPQPQYQEPFQFPEFPEMSFEMPAFPEFPAFPAPFDPSIGEAKRKGEEEQAKLREIERRRKGYSSTLLTGGQGPTDDPTLKKPSLLGS